MQQAELRDSIPSQPVLCMDALHVVRLPLVAQMVRICLSAGELGSIPGWGRFPGGGHGNPLQHSCLENPMDRGAWWATVHRVAKSQTGLKQNHSTRSLFNLPQFNSVQSLSDVRLFVTPWTAACQASLSVTNCQSLLKLMSIESMMPSNHLIPLSSASPPAFNLSQQQGFLK